MKSGPVRVEFKSTMNLGQSLILLSPWIAMAESSAWTSGLFGCAAITASACSCASSVLPPASNRLPRSIRAL